MDSPLVTMLVTCHTEGCENADVPIAFTYGSDVTVVMCGPCDQPITDITPA